MTIHELLTKWAKDSVPARETRIARLKEIGAPEIVIKRDEELLELAKDGVWYCKHSNLYWDEDVIWTKQLTGNGGKRWVYILTTKSKLAYFPNGRYGSFITEYKGKDIEK